MKKAGVKRGKVRNANLPRTKVVDFGFSKTILKIEKAVDLIYKRR